MKKHSKQPVASIEVPTSMYEYLLLINPSEQVRNEVMEIKNTFNDRFHHIQAVESKPHITLINFGEDVAKEEILVIRIGEVVKFHQPFDVVLNGINHFEPHTIFIDIVDKQPIIQLVKSMYETLKLERNAFFSRKPHLTIAKGLNPDKFKDAMTEFSGITYSNSFFTDKIVLMKRKERFHKYEIVKEFYLTGKPGKDTEAID